MDDFLLGGAHQSERLFSVSWCDTYVISILITETSQRFEEFHEFSGTFRPSNWWLFLKIVRIIIRAVPIRFSAHQHDIDVVEMTERYGDDMFKLYSPLPKGLLDFLGGVSLKEKFLCHSSFHIVSEEEEMHSCTAAVYVLRVLFLMKMDKTFQNTVLWRIPSICCCGL